MKGFISFLCISLRLSASVKKCLPLVVGSHSNFLLSQLDREQPNAELQKGAAARTTACIIEFPAVTYINLDYLALPPRSGGRHSS